MFTYIDSIDDLAYLNQELSQKTYLGVDTEFRRTTKENMKLALLQVNDEEEIYLIDTILIRDPGEHASFLFSESVLKILHSCKEDLEAIFSWANKELVNIFDTQIANSLLGGEYTMKYAALDVEYLIHIYKLQEKKLSKSSKLKWLNQDIERLLRATFNPLITITELERPISRAQEVELLEKFNKIVNIISDQEEINPTLFFSKKAQKDFLRLALSKGFDLACEELTVWRTNLIREPLLDILK